MDKTYSIAEARNDLSGVVREAEAGRPVTLSRRGKAVAVVLSAAGFGARAPQAARSLAEAIAELRHFRESCRTGKIDLRQLIEAGRR